jgi:hypothetical protein
LKREEPGLVVERQVICNRVGPQISCSIRCWRANLLGRFSPAKFAIGRNKTHVPNLKYRMHSNGAPGTDPQCVSGILQAATFALDRLQALRMANAMSPEQVKCISDQIVQRYNCDLVQNGRAFVIRTHNSDQRFDLVTDFFHHHH